MVASSSKGDSASSAGDQSVLSRDWTVTAHEVYYATGDGKLLLEDLTVVIPGSCACAIVGPSVADKGALLRLLSGAARGGYFSGRIAYGGQPYHDAHLLSAFVESAHGNDWESSFLGGGGGGGGDALSVAEALECATYLRFGYTRDATRGAERWTAITSALGLDDARGLSPRAQAVLVRIACAVVRSPPIVCVDDPFRGLEPTASAKVAEALAGLSARGFTVIASLDAAGLPETAFDRAFSRAIVMRDGRVLYCGETRHAATQCAAACSSRGGAAAALRLDAMEQCSGDPFSAKKCRENYLESATARRVEQEASHVEAIDEERSSVHWLSPPHVPQATKARVLFARSMRRASRGSHLLGLPVFSERHLGAIGVALVWSAWFWDAARLGRDSLSYYDLTAVAFACGQIVVAATLAAAPELCRMHAEFERERRARDCAALEHLVVRTAVNVVDAAALAVAPLALYVAAGLPVGPSVLFFVYGSAALLAFSCSALVEALAAWTHAPPPADSYGGGGVDFETERSLARRAERNTRGTFGALMSCMFLSTGFGIELAQLKRTNPFYWHSRVNHLRWFVQGVVLRVHSSPHFHANVNLTGTGWARYDPKDTLLALAVLALVARAVSAYFLSIDPPKLRHVDARKLTAWATRPPSPDLVSSSTIPPQIAQPVEEDESQGVSEKKVEVAGDSDRARKFQEDALDEASSTSLPSRLSRSAFATAIEAYPVTIAAHGVSLAWKRLNGTSRITPVVADVTLSVSARESVLICSDDKDAPRCLLRALAGRDCRRGEREEVGGSGRVAVNGAERQRDWRTKCAWLAAHEGRLEAVSSLSPRQAVKYALLMGSTRGGYFGSLVGAGGGRSTTSSSTAATQPSDAPLLAEEGRSPDHQDGRRNYVARSADGDFAAPTKRWWWWIEVALDVAEVPVRERDAVVADLSVLTRRRTALACELVLAPVAVFCDDLGGGARAASAGSREALSPRDAAAFAATCASLAELGCAVVATAQSPARSVVVAFDRVALLVTKQRLNPRPTGGTQSSTTSATTMSTTSRSRRMGGGGTFSYLAADEPPSTVLSSIEGGENSRDLETKPIEVALAELRRSDAGDKSASSIPEFQVGALDFTGSDPMGAATLVRPSGVGCCGALLETFVQLRREIVALVADRNVLGATLGAPLANAALLATAFWNQGRDDARSVVWLGYLLLAAFVAPASVALPRLTAAARTFGVEADAGVASPLPYALSQLFAPLPFVVARAALVVPVTFAAADFDMSPDSLGIAIASCIVAGFAANAIALSAVWLYAAGAAPNAFGLDAPTAQRRRAMIAARANDLLGLVVLSDLVFDGCFRFISDLDTPWRNFAGCNFTRWLLHAISRPQLAGQSTPDIFKPSLPDGSTRSAVKFVGYQNYESFDAFQKAILYGPIPILFVALFLLARMRTVDRE